MGNHGGQVLYLAKHRIRDKVKDKVEFWGSREGSACLLTFWGVEEISVIATADSRGKDHGVCP
jgi:hypothetical protein